MNTKKIRNKQVLPGSGKILIDIKIQFPEFVRFLFNEEFSIKNISTEELSGLKIQGGVLSAGVRIKDWNNNISCNI